MRDIIHAVALLWLKRPQHLRVAKPERHPLRPQITRLPVPQHPPDPHRHQHHDRRQPDPRHRRRWSPVVLTAFDTLKHKPHHHQRREHDHQNHQRLAPIRPPAFINRLNLFPLSLRQLPLTVDRSLPRPETHLI